MAGFRCVLALLALVSVCSMARPVGAAASNGATSYYVTGEPKSGTTWLEQLVFAIIKLGCKSPECENPVHDAANRSTTFSRGGSGQIMFYAHKTAKFLLPGAVGECRKRSFDFRPPCGLKRNSGMENVEKMIEVKADKTTTDPQEGYIAIMRSPADTIISEFFMMDVAFNHKASGKGASVDIIQNTMQSKAAIRRMELFINRRFTQHCMWSTVRYLWHKNVLNKTSHLVFYDDLMKADKSPEVLQSIADFIGIGGKLTEEDLKQIKDMTSKEAIEKLAKEGAFPSPFGTEYPAGRNAPKGKNSDAAGVMKVAGVPLVDPFRNRTRHIGMHFADWPVSERTKMFVNVTMRRFLHPDLLEHWQIGAPLGSSDLKSHFAEMMQLPGVGGSVPLANGPFGGVMEKFFNKTAKMMKGFLKGFNVTSTGLRPRDRRIAERASKGYNRSKAERNGDFIGPGRLEQMQNVGRASRGFNRSNAERNGAGSSAFMRQMKKAAKRFDNVLEDIEKNKGSKGGLSLPRAVADGEEGGLVDGSGRRAAAMSNSSATNTTAGTGTLGNSERRAGSRGIGEKLSRKEREKKANMTVAE